MTETEEPNPIELEGVPSTMAWLALVTGVASWTVLPVTSLVLDSVFLGICGGSTLGFLGALFGWYELKRIDKGQSPEVGRRSARMGWSVSVANLAFLGVSTGLFVAMGLLKALEWLVNLPFLFWH